MKNVAASGELPLVSVVVPTYNRADLIAETLASVIDQSYPNIEIIVIDDGSTDDTASVVQRFPHVKYVRQSNAERGAARNHGLRLAQGKYIAFLDSDDLWLPDKVARGVAFLEDNPQVGLIYTDVMQIDGSGRALRFRRGAGPSGRITRALLKWNFIFFSTQLARTALIRAVHGFREERELSGSEDWEMLVRLSLTTDFAYRPGVTAKIRVHAGNTMGDAFTMWRSTHRAADLLRAYGPLEQGYSRYFDRMDAFVALANAINFCGQKDVKETMVFLKKAALASPSIMLDLRFAYTLARLCKVKLAPVT